MKQVKLVKLFLMIAAVFFIWQGCTEYSDYPVSNNNPFVNLTTTTNVNVLDLIQQDQSDRFRAAMIETKAANPNVAAAILKLIPTSGKEYWVADIWDLSKPDFSVRLDSSCYDGNSNRYIFAARLVLSDGSWWPVTRMTAASASNPNNKVQLLDIRTNMYPNNNEFGPFFVVGIQNGQIVSPENSFQPAVVLYFEYRANVPYGQVMHSQSVIVDPAYGNQRGVLFYDAANRLYPMPPVLAQTNHPFYIEFTGNIGWRQVMDSCLYVQARSIWGGTLTSWTQVVHRSAWLDLHDWTTTDGNWWFNKIMVNYNKNSNSYSIDALSDNRRSIYGGGGSKDSIIITPIAPRIERNAPVQLTPHPLDVRVNGTLQYKQTDNSLNSLK